MDDSAERSTADEYDSPWKEAIERYFEAFIARISLNCSASSTG
jgi:hypothetical protein